MSNRDIRIVSNSSRDELACREKFLELFRRCPIPDRELLSNLGLFINRQTLSRILFMHDLYQRILDVHGIVVEFGVRWGQNLALFSAFRGMYEPFNYNRKIVGFDTFEGFVNLDPKDGRAEIASAGGYSVTEGYEKYLDAVLDYHETESPLAHLKKYELVKGDACVTIDQYFRDNPETIVALAYFDFDVYLPTRKCLEAIQGRITKGTVIGFDELNWHNFPGETLALKEVLGLDRFRIVRSPLNPSPSFIVVE